MVCQNLIIVPKWFSYLDSLILQVQRIGKHSYRSAVLQLADSNVAENSLTVSKEIIRINAALMKFSKL